jgi:ubiquinone/menaquinone biosynthesis C-methylase UbiE
MFSDPRKNLDQFDLAPSMKVADFGSGAGYYTFLISRIVGSSGRVYALDVQKDLLVTLKREATKARLLNIEVVRADFEEKNGTKLRDQSVDRGIVTNVLFQIEHKENFVREIARVLRPGGKVLVIDWADSFGGIGPEQKAVFTLEACRDLFIRSGFELDRSIDAGVHHYGLIFKKV